MEEEFEDEAKIKIGDKMMIHKREWKSVFFLRKILKNARSKRFKKT